MSPAAISELPHAAHNDSGLGSAGRCPGPAKKHIPAADRGPKFPQCIPDAPVRRVCNHYDATLSPLRVTSESASGPG